MEASRSGVPTPCILTLRDWLGLTRPWLAGVLLRCTLPELVVASVKMSVLADDAEKYFGGDCLIHSGISNEECNIARLWNQGVEVLWSPQPKK